MEDLACVGIAAALGIERGQWVEDGLVKTTCGWGLRSRRKLKALWRVDTCAHARGRCAGHEWLGGIAGRWGELRH
jgi:hypothetical protein